ncbi:bromodomain-containing protein 4-like isoform X2 [Ptychodera flava]|uniref:bromodomain-containing protein 4-like isoform X2 n=2 Tax=Ptychodera flava TaxID=63121 RepID=UPI00396A9AF5
MSEEKSDMAEESQDENVAMMDLLVHVAAKNKLSPAGHVIRVPAPYPGDEPVQYKPNTQVGDLGVRTIEIVPKKEPQSKVPVKKSAKFEQTVRLTVHVSKSKKFVLRVNPDKALCELLPQICEEHGTDPFHCTLRLVNSPEEDLDLFRSLNDYSLPENEVILVDLRAPVPKVPVPEEKTKEKKKKSIFGFRSSQKKKSKGDGDADSVKSVPVKPAPQKQIRDTDSIKSAPPARPVSQIHVGDSDSVKSMPVRPHSVVNPPPAPGRQGPPPGAVALPIIDGSLLRKQQQQPQPQQANQSAPPPPQPPARKRQAPRPPGPPPRKNQVPGVKGSPAENQVKAEVVVNQERAAPQESPVQVVHVENVNQSPNATLQSNENSPLGDRIVIGQESHFALTDSHKAAVAVSLQNPPASTPSPQGQTPTSGTTTTTPSSTEPSSGTLKKRKAPPPPKPAPPQPNFAGTPPSQVKREGTPPGVKKRAPPQPSPRHQRQTSTGSTVSAGSDSSSGQMIDSSPAATPPSTLDRPDRPPRRSTSPSQPKESQPPPPGQIAGAIDERSEGLSLRKRPPKPPRPQSYAGEALAESTRSKRPCSFIAPPPPEEPPSPESAPEDIEKLIQEGRLSIATTQRRDSLTDHATTEDSCSDRSTSALSASARSSLLDDEETGTEREEEKKSDGGDEEAEDLAEMLNDVVKEQEKETVTVSSSVDIEPPLQKVITITAEAAPPADIDVQPSKEVTKESKKPADVSDDDDIELTEEEAKILAELEAEADAEEAKETKDGESSATESEDIALKEERSQILSQMMKLSLDDQNSNDTVNYSPSAEPEQEMLEEKLISQLAYPVVRNSHQQVPVGYALKSEDTPEISVKKIEIAPEAESTESQQDEEREMTSTSDKEIDVEAMQKEKKMIVDDVESNEESDKEEPEEREDVTKGEPVTIEESVTASETVKVAEEDVVVELKDIKLEVERKDPMDKAGEKYIVDGEVKESPEPSALSATPIPHQLPTDAKALQEQYTMLQKQFAALQQQMITNQQAVLQQQQQQIVSASSAAGQPVPPAMSVGNPMMVSQPPMVMSPAMTPQQQQMMMMQQQMMMQYPMGMPQYMMTPQMMAVPPAAPMAVSPPQVIGYPAQPVLATSPQQVVLATSPPQHQQPQQVEPEPQVTVASPPNMADPEPEVEMPEVEHANEPEEKTERPKPFGIEIDSQGNMIKSSLTVQQPWKEDTTASDTLVGSRNRTSSNPISPGATDHNTARPRAGTFEKTLTDWPPKSDAAQQEKKIVIVEASKPVEPKEDKDKRDIVIVENQQPPQPQKVPESKPREVVIIESAPKPPPEPSKPKEDKPTRDIVIIENNPKSQPVAVATSSASANKDKNQAAAGRPGYSQYAPHGGIPKSKPSLQKAASEVQIRYLHSAREDELSATRESASVSRLRGIFGGAEKS